MTTYPDNHPESIEERIIDHERRSKTVIAMKDIKEMTRKEFEAIPHHDFDKDLGTFASLVILPLRTMHDSGYRCMDFVAVNVNDEPICRLSGCSDIIHIDGIGGYGYRWIRKGGVPEMIPPKGWSIDCLPKSGLLRIFANNGLIQGGPFSSFELWAEKLPIVIV